MAFGRLQPTNRPRRHKNADDAQWLLAGNNRFKQKTYRGKIDGLYGEVAGHAADRMRYWLGYPRWNLAGVFGEQLYSYLLPLSSSSARKLPLAYRLRRKARLLKEKKRLAGLAKHGKTKALAAALTQVGYHEVGHNNDNKFGRWFGWNGVAWCAQFVTWAMVAYGGKKFRTALARQFMYWAHSGTFGLRITHNPEPGDIVVFDSGGGHVGIFKSGNARQFTSVEGNTSCAGGSWDNGGEVCIKTHDRSRNPVFVRVP